MLSVPGFRHGRQCGRNGGGGNRGGGGGYGGSREPRW